MTSCKHILAIDLGTSGCKCAAVSLNGKVAHWAFEPVELKIIGHSGAEQDPADWWNAFLAAAGSVVASAREDGLEFSAVCASTQGEGTLAVDRQGKPLSNALTWLDMRGAEAIQRSAGTGMMSVSGYNPVKLARWIQMTGGAPALSGKDPAGHMLFIRDNWPEIYENTHCFLGALDYINFRLTGRMASTRDAILTSWITDNRDPTSIQYHDGLVRMLGIDRDKLPEIIDCTDTVGSLLPGVAEAIGLEAGLPVIGGSMDTSAAAVGSGAVADGDVHLYIGTSSWLGAHVPAKKTSVLSQIAAVPCALKDRYLMTALQSAAGSNMAFLRDRVFFCDDELHPGENPSDIYQTLDRMAARVPAGARGLLYTPWLFGERCPVDDGNLRAAFLNLSMQHERADMVRAVMEGVALNTGWALQAARKFLAGYPVDEITVIGGGGSSGVWCQILADVMDISIRQPEAPIESNVLGSAFIAAVGLGELDFNDVPGLVKYRKTYQPDTGKREAYDALARTFNDAYKTLAPFYRRLNSNQEDLST